MKTRTWITAAAGVMATLALLAWAFAPRPVEVETAAVTEGPFETTIDEDGKTRLRDRYVVSAPLAGVLARITLREGDTVQAGVPLATLMPGLSPLLDERSLREQQARIEVAHSQVQRARARVEGSQVALQQAINEMRRSEQLAQQGFVAPTKLETDRLAVRAAQKTQEAAVGERHMAEHELEQARATLTAGRAPANGKAAFVLRAPTAGRVLRVLNTSEGVVALGTALIELGDLAELEVVAELLTTDALQAQPGSAVMIERWGGEGLLQGRVRAVEPAAFTKVSALGVEEQRVRVLIDLTSAPHDWRALGDGFRVGVRIVTRALDKAVKVPVSAVFPLPADAASGPGGTAVFVFDNGRARLQPVRIGARNNTEAWVQTGLAPGARVIVYPPAGVGDGVRVKERRV